MACRPSHIDFTLETFALTLAPNILRGASDVMVIRHTGAWPSAESVPSTRTVATQTPSISQPSGTLSASADTEITVRRWLQANGYYFAKFSTVQTSFFHHLQSVMKMPRGSAEKAGSQQCSVSTDIYIIDGMHDLNLNLPKTGFKYSFMDRMDEPQRTRFSRYLNSIGCQLDVRAKGKRNPEEKWSHLKPSAKRSVAIALRLACCSLPTCVSR